MKHLTLVFLILIFFEGCYMQEDKEKTNTSVDTLPQAQSTQTTTSKYGDTPPTPPVLD